MLRLVEHHKAFPVRNKDTRCFFARSANCFLALFTNNVVIVDVDVVSGYVDIRGVASSSPLLLFLLSLSLLLYLLSPAELPFELLS